MTSPQVSVVVVSCDRPAALLRCVTGLAQLQYSPFEIVVVADAQGCEALGQSRWADDVKLVQFDRPNISEARNLGVCHAAGEIVAFIDDDALPEPDWLTQLAAPFSRADVGAAGGFVRGRNGISFQWKARSVDQNGHTAPLEVDAEHATVLHPKGGRAIKTEGTNMAVRRDILVDLEGFDPAFAFYLDETDLNLRLARAGIATAIVPMAEVHHGFAASVRRRDDRVPRDLFDIGASWAVFQRKYVDQATRADHWKAITAHERKRVMAHMVAGRLLPSDLRHLMKRLALGYADGTGRKRGGGHVSRSAVAPFRRFPSVQRNSVLLSGRIWQRRTLRAQAERRAKDGEIVTLILLSHTALFHHIRFDQHGYWEQNGGMFGKSDRDDPIFRLFRFSNRIKREWRRVAKKRGAFI